MSDPAPILFNSLDSALQTLRTGQSAPTPLFPGGTHEQRLPGDVFLHSDPALRAEGTWASPRGRLLEIVVQIHQPGRWLALHVPLPRTDLAGVTWLALALRTSAVRATAIRPCLRSGVTQGFRDDFFPLAVLAQPRESDHLDQIAPARMPDLPPEAAWRELILFLPPASDQHLALHELRLVTL